MDPSGDPEYPTGAAEKDANDLFGVVNLDDLYHDPTLAPSPNIAGTFPDHPNPEIDDLPTVQDSGVPYNQSTVLSTDNHGPVVQQHASLQIGNWLAMQEQTVQEARADTTLAGMNAGSIQEHTQHTTDFPDLLETTSWDPPSFPLGMQTAGQAHPFQGFDPDFRSAFPGTTIQDPQAASSWTNNTFNGPVPASLGTTYLPMFHQGGVHVPPFSVMTTRDELTGPANAASQFADWPDFQDTIVDQPSQNSGHQQHDADAWMNDLVDFDAEASSNREDENNLSELDHESQIPPVLGGAQPDGSTNVGQGMQYTWMHTTTSSFAPGLTTQLPLPPSSPIPVQSAPSQVPQQASPANVGAAQGTTQGGGSSGRRRTLSNNPRLPRVRDIMPRSAPHQRFPGNLVASQQANRFGRGRRAGLNQLALFGQDDVPRTIHALRVDRGRSGRASSSQYPSADQDLPARLSLEEICQQYPNHVWGSLLRIFIAEGWTAERIWQALPAGYRHNEASTRPWNYIQAAFGREIDQMTKEETGHKRVPSKRKRDDGTNSAAGIPPLPQLPSGPAIPLAPLSLTSSIPALLPSAPAPLPSVPVPAQTMDNMTIQELQHQVYQHIERAQNLLRQIERLRNQSTSENTVAQAAVQQYRTRQEGWIQGVANQFGHNFPGEDLASLNIVQLIRRVFELHNPALLGNETLLAYQARTTRAAWRRYLGLVTSWVTEDEQNLNQMVQLVQELYD